MTEMSMPDALRRSNRALWVLSECNQTLVRADDEMKFLQDICRIIVEIGGYRLVWVGYAGDDPGQSVRPVAQYGFEEGYLDTLKITWADTERGRGPTGTAVRTGNPVICKNILTDPNFAPWRSQAVKRGYASSIALPLFEKNQRIGALNIYADEADAFDQDEVKLLSELARDISYGIRALRTQKKHRQAEEEFRRERDLLTRIAETSPVGITLVDKDGQIQFANSRAEKILGLTKSQITQRTYNAPEWKITDYDGNPFPGEALPFIRIKKEKTTLMGIRHAIQWPDGRRVLLSINASPLIDEANNPEGMVATIEDVTEAVLAEKELQHARREWEDIFRAIGHPTTILAPDQTILAVNRATIEATGLSKEELIGKKCFEIFHKNNQSPHCCPMEKVILSGSLETETMEIEALGGYFFVSCTPIIDEKGKLQSVIHIATDITERIKAEKALQQNEATLSSIFRAAPVGIGLVSRRILKKVNDQLCTMTGYSREELLEQSARMLYATEEEYNYVGKEKYRQISIYGTGSVETRWQRQDGQMIDILLSSTPLDPTDWSIGVTFTALDITVRKQAEKLLQQHNEELEQYAAARTAELQEKTRELESANIQLKKADQLKSVFLASMSHELRTPLNSIIGFTGILLMEMAGELNPEQKKQLDMVKNSANHLLNLINDILDISKIEAGKVDLTLTTFPLDEVIAEVKEIFSNQFKEKGLVLIIDVPAGITLVSDARRVKQILFNLVSNAFKFTSKGSITINGFLIPGEKLEISVTDTGIGIKKEAMSKLFNPFQQIDDSLTRQFEGTGLGLYLCKSLLSLLSGEISARSEYGKGSIFSFTLPLGAVPR